MEEGGAVPRITRALAEAPSALLSLCGLLSQLGDGLHVCGLGAVKSEASQGFAHCCLLPGFGDLCA